VFFIQRSYNKNPLYKQPKMTYILGSRCKDGVVLIVDRKFTIDAGAGYEYDDKLFGDLAGVIVGFSGSRGTFEILRTRIRDYVITEKGVTIDKLVLKLADTILELGNKYGRGYDYGFDVLVGIQRVDITSILHYIYPNGTLEPVRNYKAIGAGSPYGSIYLKKIWNKDMTMEEVAELGYFIIRYVERFGLDLTVGAGDNVPQI
jgi:20S proteasome alpha/beta subunit